MDNNWSQKEYAAYSAYEAAKAGLEIGTILKNLGHYNQGVVDAAASARSKAETKAAPTKGKNKSKKVK